MKELVKCGASVVALSKTAANLDSLKAEVLFPYKNTGMCAYLYDYDITMRSMACPF